MREHHVEAYLVSAVAALGGVCIKLTPMGDSGWPDRLVLLPGGRLGFLELKRPGKAPTALQFYRLGVLEDLGFAADWANTPAGVSAFLRRLTGQDAETAAINRLADEMARA